MVFKVALNTITSIIRGKTFPLWFFISKKSLSVPKKGFQLYYNYSMGYMTTHIGNILLKKKRENRQTECRPADHHP
jgi:hypothetical protein